MFPTYMGGRAVTTSTKVISAGFAIFMLFSNFIFIDMKRFLKGYVIKRILGEITFRHFLRCKFIYS